MLGPDGAGLATARPGAYLLGEGLLSGFQGIVRAYAVVAAGTIVPAAVVAAIYALIQDGHFPKSLMLGCLATVLIPTAKFTCIAP